MILVTGATGHVGRAVVSRLASLGHDVVAMVRDVQAASRRLASGIALRVADYEDASALKRALAGIDDMVLISSDGAATKGQSSLAVFLALKEYEWAGCGATHGRRTLDQLFLGWIGPVTGDNEAWSCWLVIG
jgi:uncharacterized protein YbjT (DUF2867 family)